MRKKILFDSYQEGMWFKGLDPRFNNFTLEPIPRGNTLFPHLNAVLKFDRPDVIVMLDDEVIISLERTEEVPTGHNVGQRFGRVVAAAEARVPMVYFFPYAAMKHGGATAGRRFVNLRFFDAVEKTFVPNDVFVGLPKWPVDSEYELLRDSSKDSLVSSLVSDILDYRLQKGVIPGYRDLIHTAAVKQMRTDIKSAQRKYANPRYDRPPPSVLIGLSSEITKRHKLKADILSSFEESVVYQVGMKKLRSDPYPGCGMLYERLYGRDIFYQRTKHFVYHFPYISEKKWMAQGRSNPNVKHYSLYLNTSDVIIFTDGFVKGNLGVP